MMNFPDQDTFRAYCITKSYPKQYNDGLKKALETDLGVTGFALPDLMRQYYDANGANYLYP
jgi:hypothetical protein